MRRTVFAAFCAALICGCGGAAHRTPPSTGALPQPTIFVEPESAITPEGARPAPPPGLTAFPVTAHIDAAGINLIGGFEGFSSCPYRDVVGVWTIGYGVTSGSGTFVGPRTACESRTTGLAQLRSLVLRDYEPAVHAVSPSFGQHAVDALDSFDYNLGAGIFVGTLRADLARHDYQAAGSIMLSYDHAGGRVIPGLLTRRRIEVALLRTPDAHVASRKDLLTRQRVLRRVLLADGCDRRRDHRQKLGPTCARWFREGAAVGRELRR